MAKEFSPPLQQQPTLVDADAQLPVIRECFEQQRLFEGKSAPQLGASNFVGVPIMAGGVAIGVLAIGGDSVSQAAVAELGPFVASVSNLIVAQRETDRRRAAEEDAQRLARQDVLTGLGNRRMLIDEFDGRTDHPDVKFALVLIDLDRFKPINDTHGHLVGDQVLRIVAKRLRHCVRDDCAIARLGGDEFAILPEPRADFSGVEELAARVVEKIREPISVGSLTVSVGASVGVAVYPRDADNAQDLLRKADAAMYRAKTRRGEAQFFDASIDEGIRERAELETELRAAVQSGDILPYFQPSVQLNTNAIIGHEVLARWPHPQRGMVSPAQFVPIAEEAGLIKAIFRSLLRSACRAHIDAGLKTTLSFNISPAQVKDPYFSQNRLGALAQLNFPLHRLEIEITESAMLGDIDRIRPLLISLKNQGVRIALDDFGTGYSSLLLLRDLPIDKVKIDRSFISGDKGSEQSCAVIVDAILGLASALKLSVTAEGIEDAEAAGLLREKGCQFGQGFLFGAATPMPATCIDDANNHGRQVA